MTSGWGVARQRASVGVSAVDARAVAEQLAARLTLPAITRETVAAEVMRGQQENVRIADAVELADVRVAVAHFNRQERVLAARGMPFPCVAVPGDLPLPVAVPLRELRAAEDVRALRLPDDDDHPVELVPPDVARDILRRRLAAFLEPRVADTARRKADRASGHKFRVETPGRSGLRVHWTGATILDPTNRFGNTLSTPVDSVLRSGRYMFGTLAAGDTAVRWDLSATYLVPGPVSIAQVY